jgi:transposase InsO family protein
MVFPDIPAGCMLWAIGPSNQVKPRQINELYQAAFAGLPIPGHRVHHMLAVLDCFSRYLLALRVCSAPTAQALIEGLETALHETRTTSQLAEDRQISLVVDCGPAIRPSEISNCISRMPFLLISPTTRTFQSLGMIRRLIWTVKDEEISLHLYSDPSEAQYSLERFRHTYNFERPHQALGYCVPADLFCRKPGSRSIN